MSEAGCWKTMPRPLHKVSDPLITVCLYTVLYVGWDRISMVHVLPELGFTLWNPPPACSLVLLLTKGLRFAPALFPAAVLADGLNTGFSIGVVPTLVTDAIIASGYSIVAVVLRHFVDSADGLQTTRNMTWFLVVVFAGTLVIAVLVCTALLL